MRLGQVGWRVVNVPSSFDGENMIDLEVQLKQVTFSSIPIFSIIREFLLSTQTAAW